MKRILILTSGNGGTVKFLKFLISNNLLYGWEIIGVVVDRYCGAYEYALSENIATKQIDYSQREGKVDSLLPIIVESKPDVVLTNIHKIIDDNTLTKAQTKFINLHYSILPAFSGYIGLPKIVAAARKQRVCLLGSTLHNVDNNVDGGEVLTQGWFVPDWSLSDDKIIDAVFKNACLCMFGYFKWVDTMSKFSSLSEISIDGLKMFFSPSFIDSLPPDYVWKYVKS